MQSHPLANTEGLWLFKYLVESVSHINTWLGALLVTTKIKETGSALKGKLRLVIEQDIPSSRLIFYYEFPIKPRSCCLHSYPITTQRRSQQDFRWRPWDFYWKKKCIFNGILQKKTPSNLREKIDCFHHTGISRLNYIILELHAVERLRDRFLVGRQRQGLWLVKKGNKFPWWSTSSPSWLETKAWQLRTKAL